MRMKKAGRISFVLLAVIVALVAGVFVFVFLLSGEAPESVATKFLAALSKGDPKTLTALSYMGSEPESNIEQKWQFTVDVTRYYQFKYLIEGVKQVDPDAANVQVEMMKDANRPGAVPEHFELPMVKINNHWKVDLRALNREIYPALPRA